MKVTVLSDNNGNKYLLDTGGSNLFLDNAGKLGIDISEVDCAVLSHAHYDHSLGMEAFFRANSKADFYVSPNARENCYAGFGFLSKYIGLPKGILSTYRDRINMPSGISEIDDGVFVVPHSTDDLSKIGRRNHLYVRRGWNQAFLNGA